MVAPLVEAVLLRLLRRRATTESVPAPGRLVGEPHAVDTLGYVAEGTSVLLRRPGAGAEVLPAGSVVLPSLLGRSAPTTVVVVTHEPVDVWLRVGPFETLEGRVVQQVELRLRVAVSTSASGLTDLAAEAGEEDLGDTLLGRLAREVTAKAADAIHRRTLSELTGMSVQVLLEGSLPTTFLGGLVTRTGLEVDDVDWPTEGHGWAAATLEAWRRGGSGPAGTGLAGSAPR